MAFPRPPISVLADIENCANPHRPRSLHATVEHADEAGMDDVPSPASSEWSSTTISRNSIVSLSDLDVEDIIINPSPLCRRDIASEIAMSLWGLVKPKNFDKVMDGVYRSSYPQEQHFAYLRTKGFKSILTLVPETLPDSYRQFIDENGIQHFQFGIEKNKDPSVTIPPENMSAALSVMMDLANRPILIHCNKGKHRTGCVVACLRKVLGSHSAEAIIEEYRHYADIKARELDIRFIERFDERPIRAKFLNPIKEPVKDSPIQALSIRTRMVS